MQNESIFRSTTTQQSCESARQWPIFSNSFKSSCNNQDNLHRFFQSAAGLAAAQIKIWRFGISSIFRGSKSSLLKIRSFGSRILIFGLKIRSLGSWILIFDLKIRSLGSRILIFANLEPQRFNLSLCQPWASPPVRNGCCLFCFTF